MSSIRYPSGSRTKQSRGPFSLTVYGGFSASIPCSRRRSSVASRSGGGHRDVVVAGAQLVRVDAEVVGQLQARAVAGEAHEDVDRLVADRHPADLLESEGLVEGDRPVDVADAVAGVDQLGHGPQRIPAKSDLP